MPVKLKKHHVSLQHFVLFLTIGFLFGCSPQKAITHVDGTLVPVKEQIAPQQAIDVYVKPYRDAIEKNLGTVLAYAPENLDKFKGEWQTNIGCMMADAAMLQSDPVFFSRTKQHIDFCLLNQGGIRANITKGDVTTRSAYEVMPFENSMVVAALDTQQIMEIAFYIIKEKKPHPLSGLTFTIGKDGMAKDIRIQRKPLIDNHLYYVLTSDYLANGGDNMSFFTKAKETTPLDYKLRSVLIDYFTKVDTIPVDHQPRITVE